MDNDSLLYFATSYSGPLHKAIGRVFFCVPQDRDGLPSTTGKLRLFHEFDAAEPHP